MVELLCVYKETWFICKSKWTDMENGRGHWDKQSDSLGLNCVYTFTSYVTLGKSFTFSTSVSLFEVILISTCRSGWGLNEVRYVKHPTVPETQLGIHFLIFREQLYPKRLSSLGQQQRQQGQKWEEYPEANHLLINAGISEHIWNVYPWNECIPPIVRLP